MALMQITIIPMGTATPSVGQYVAGVAQMLREKGVEHEVNDMGTVIQGEADELLALAREIHAYPFSQGAQRVVTHIVLDERTDQMVRIGDKRRAALAKISGERNDEKQ